MDTIYASGTRVDASEKGAASARSDGGASVTITLGHTRGGRAEGVRTKRGKRGNAIFDDHAGAVRLASRANINRRKSSSGAPL